MGSRHKSAVMFRNVIPGSKMQIMPRDITGPVGTGQRLDQGHHRVSRDGAAIGPGTSQGQQARGRDCARDITGTVGTGPRLGQGHHRTIRDGPKLGQGHHKASWEGAAIQG